LASCTVHREAARSAAEARAAEALQETGEHQNTAPSHGEARDSRNDPLLSDRHGGFEILVGGAHQIHVTITRGRDEALERACLDKGLTVPFQALQALDIGPHGVALAADQIVGIGPQAVDCAFAAVTVGHCVAIEAFHDAAPREKDRAAASPQVFA